MVHEPTGIATDRRILVVRSGASRLAVPTEDVVRVVRDLTCYPVPGSGPHLLGLAQYGGEPLPVLDLQAMVEGAAPGGLRSATIILGRGRERTHSLVGLAVDEVLRVTDLAIVGSPGGNTGLVLGVAEIEGENMKIVNTKRLLGGIAEESGAMDE
jgi:chemotaxis signal transduction protein